MKFTYMFDMIHLKRCNFIWILYSAEDRSFGFQSRFCN